MATLAFNRAEIAARELKPELLEMDGISRASVEAHYKLYQGYVAKRNEILAKLGEVDLAAANQVYSEIRALKVDLTFAIGGVKNHEIYFEHLGGGGGNPDGAVGELISRDFGSADAWRADLKATGMAGRGWAWTAYDFDEQRLFNYVGDAQNTFPIWNAAPLVALDVYEHAYFLDYQTDRASYIEAFFGNLDWDVVNGWVDRVRYRAITDALLIAAGYVLGSMPWGYWLPRLLRGVDIRTLGSGNPGATNVWRTLGFKFGIAVALLDIAKGAAAALLGLWLGGDLVGVLAGVAAMIGHWRPLFLGFARGGKIVATTGGVALAIAPLPALSAAAVWIVVFLAFRYASVASIAAAVSLPLWALLFGASWPVVAFTAGAALAIVVLHRTNIRRLLAGEEHGSSSAARGWAARALRCARSASNPPRRARSQSPSSVWRAL